MLATPAAPTARLLAEVAPAAAAELAGDRVRLVAVVTLAFRAADVPDALFGGALRLPRAAGRAARRIKASTFSFAKWAWVRAAAGAPTA